MGDWKLIAGDPGSFNGLYPAPEDPVALRQACPVPVHQRRPQKSHKMLQQQQSQQSRHTTDLQFEPHTERAPGHSLNNVGENRVHDAQCTYGDGGEVARAERTLLDVVRCVPFEQQRAPLRAFARRL